MDGSAKTQMRLVLPAREYLASYAAALERGWSPDNVRGVEAAREELQRIAADADAFLSSMDDREAKGQPIALPDGSYVPRLPGWRRWMWDGEFAGNIGFRWQPGTSALPPYCLGHIGYGVVPWKQGRGYATTALALVLPEALAEGLDYVELTTEPDNLASQRVIEANGGRLVERFTKTPQYGSAPGLRYRIDLVPGSRSSL
jgi:predicted acetyltransferase